MNEEMLEKELEELKEEVNKLKEENKRKEFYFVVAVLLVIAIVGSYTVARSLRTAANEKAYYEEKLEQKESEEGLHE